MSDSNTDSQLQKALALNSAGIPVFPCNDRKEPIIAGGFKAATLDREQVITWWTKSPTARIGVPTGAASGIWVVDCDVDSCGVPIGEQTLATHGLSNHAHRVPSPSGGAHYLFRHNAALPRNSVKRLPGVDIRGEGGYVIVWSPDGLLAAKLDPELGYPPPTLVEALRARKTILPQPLDPDDNKSAMRILEQEADKVAAAVEGSRNDSLNRSSYRVGKQVARGALDGRKARDALRAAALVAGLPRQEIEKTISGAFAAASTDDAQVPKSQFEPRHGDTTDTSDKTTWPDPDWSVAITTRRDPPTFPTEMFPPDLAQWLTLAAGAKGAPLDYVAGSLLSAASSLIGNSRWVTPWPMWAEPPVLWLMLIGAPSTNKSPAMDAVLDPLRAVERRVQQRARADFEVLKRVEGEHDVQR